MRKKKRLRTILTVISTWVVTSMLIGCASENGEGIARNEENVVGNDEPSSSASEFNLDLMTIIEHERSDSLSEDDHLSLEEAALAGVEYILEFFDFNFEGTYMQLQHIADGENSIFNYNGSIWSGTVSRSERFNSDMIFVFVVNAINGEWVYIVRVPQSREDSIQGYFIGDLIGKTVEELRELFPPPEEAEVNITLDVAKVYAQRHFRNSNLHHIEYYAATPMVIGFRAEDEHGYVIYINIQRETHNLIAIEFQ